MLLQGDASHVTDLDYPNFWHQNGLKLKLSYQFEPGQDNDGVTVHIPLPILNQISPDGFDWQIPGLRHELVVSLIKSLPKGYAVTLCQHQTMPMLFSSGYPNGNATS